MASEIEVPQDLIGRMQYAYLDAANDGTHPRCATTDCCTLGMAAALRVALEDERVLGEPSSEETIIAQRVWTISDMRQFLANRRARLLKPKTDAGVAAVKECFKGWFGADWINSGVLLQNAWINEELYKNIATAVREADAKLKAEQEAQS